MTDPISLEDKLCTPSDRLIADVEKLEGDLMILGLGGKMGPSLGKLAVNAFRAAGNEGKIMGASRFSNKGLREEMEAQGIETYAGDLLDASFLQSLPQANHIIYMAGQKFGTQGNESTTWAMNAYLPGMVARKYRDASIVAFSTGNVYPFVAVNSKGAHETTPLAPVGEYAQSCLARERIFQYFSKKNGTPTLIFRLNYALDLRYGVLNDIARAVYTDQPIDLTMGYVNVIWQGDANEFAIRSLLHTASPATALNVTGPEIASVKDLAVRFGEAFGCEPIFRGSPAQTALLSNASRSFELFGMPMVGLAEMIEMTVQWVQEGGKQINKPTHFQQRHGKF